MKLNNRYVKFMGRENEKDGDIITREALTKYFVDYIKHNCKREGPRFFLTGPLKELFTPEAEEWNRTKSTKIDLENFIFSCIPKVLVCAVEYIDDDK